MYDGPFKVFLPLLASVAGYSGAQWQHHPGQEQLPTRGNTLGPQVQIILEALQISTGLTSLNPLQPQLCNIPLVVSY